MLFSYPFFRCHKREDPRPYYFEMSSFPETKAEKLITSTPENALTFLWYHRLQLSRVYPRAQRVDSSNYNPMTMWNVGSQMAALNFQTGDKPMQVGRRRISQSYGWEALNVSPLKS